MVASTTAGKATGGLVAVVLAEGEHVEAELVGGARVGERRVEPVDSGDSADPCPGRPSSR